MQHFKFVLFIWIFFISFSSLFAQKEKEVNINTENGKLSGTLTTVKEKDAPVVIIIPGSGPTDRNGNNSMMINNSYKMLAQELANHQIASLRYDKLGIGKSESTIEDEDYIFDHNTLQVEAWIDYLEGKGFQNIILMGHSEGSMVGMLAAQKKNVSKFISLEGTGRSIDKVILEQIGDLSEGLVKETGDILSRLKEGKKVEKVSEDLYAIFHPSIQKYLISWVNLDPQKEISNLAIPILIVHGTTDFQVTKEDARLQKEGSKTAELIFIEGMNHILKRAPEDRNENLKTYYDPKLELHPDLIPTLVEFIKK